MNRFRFLSAILATLFLIAASSRAQSNEGRILGTIRDSSGGVGRRSESYRDEHRQGSVARAGDKSDRRVRCACPRTRSVHCFGGIGGFQNSCQQRRAS